MNTISSLFHRKKPSQDQTADPTQQSTKLSTESTPDQNSMNPPPSQQKPLSTPQYAPGTGPQAHAQMHNASNIGMAGGAILGSTIDGGGNGVMGMVEGGVVGNMVMQRIQQEQKHQYFREQAINYREGRPADGVPHPGGPEGALAGEGGGRDRDRGDRKETRDEKRKRRWDRRAKRRDGGKEEASDGSGSA